jgi:hypothetical protein
MKMTWEQMLQTLEKLIEEGRTNPLWDTLVILIHEYCANRHGMVAKTLTIICTDGESVILPLPPRPPEGF